MAVVRDTPPSPPHHPEPEAVLMVVVVAAAAGGRAAPLPLKITDHEEAQAGETTLSPSDLEDTAIS